MMRLPILLFASLWLACAAEAMEPQTQEAVVLRNRIFDGFEYKDNFVPSSVDRFSLVAGSDNAISVVQTLEYYWPLSRQVYMSPDRLNVSLRGELRMFSGNSVVATSAMDAYVVYYPDGPRAAGARLLWGEEAKEAARDFKNEMVNFERLLAKAEADRSRYESELLAAAKARLEGKAPPVVALPLSRPDRPKRFVSQLSEAFRVVLTEGDYEIALFEGNREYAGSRRKLSVIAPESSAGLTIDVIPEEKWTRLLPSNTVEDGIYVRPGAMIYLVANRSDLFDDAVYARLVAPQAVGIAGKPLWVRRMPAERIDVEVSSDGFNWQPLTFGGYVVRQTTGQSLGYTIEPAPNSVNPDLSAFPLHIPPQEGQSVLHLRTADAQSGNLAGGNTRKIFVVEQPNKPLIWFPSLVPLIFGIFVVGWRARKSIARTEAQPQ